MQQTLKLTITAMGEPGSIFMHPCEPITLHESQIEVDDASPPATGDSIFGPTADDALDDAAAALAEMAAPIVVLADEPPSPQRIAS